MYSILARPDPVPCGQGVAFDYFYSLHPSLVHLLLCLHLDSSLVSYCASFFFVVVVVGKTNPSLCFIRVFIAWLVACVCVSGD